MVLFFLMAELAADTRMRSAQKFAMANAPNFELVSASFFLYYLFLLLFNRSAHSAGPGCYPDRSVLGTILGASWAILGHLGTILGPSWAILAPSWAILRGLWGVLGCLGAKTLKK